MKLTSDWLLALGFEQVKNTANFSYVKKWKTKHDWEFVMEIFDMNPNGDAPIMPVVITSLACKGELLTLDISLETVRQLQNLYHAVSGQEL